MERRGKRKEKEEGDDYTPVWGETEKGRER